MFNLFTFVLIIATTTSLPAPEECECVQDCTDIPPGNYAACDNPDHYWCCQIEQSDLMECAPGTVWNDKTKNCDWPSNANADCPPQSQCINHDDCESFLHQNDFDHGTYMMDNSVTYCLAENIKFNPKPSTCAAPNVPGAWFPDNNESYPGSTTQVDGPYILGFFAVIVIGTSDITLDLCGHTIEYDFEYYIQQRWGSIIEIGNLPFVPSSGPGQFGSPMEAYDNIEIMNGILGLTSHHGIHSNSASNVVIRDLVIRDFEVGAIQLNGFNGVTIEDVQIGPSFSGVPVTAFYSNAKFLQLALRKLLLGYEDSNSAVPTITFTNRDEMSLTQIEQNLSDALDLVFQIVSGCKTESEIPNELQDLYEKSKKLFMNDADQLPDGSAMYGILLNSHSVAVNGFCQSPNSAGESVTIRNVEITGLALKVREIPAVYFDKCGDPSTDSKSIQKGPFGDVVSLANSVDETDRLSIELHGSNPDILEGIKYEGNPLVDAQIALGLYGDELGEGNAYSFGSLISDEFVEWATDQVVFPSACADFICNTDIMAHINKGLVAIRMDGIEDAIIENVNVDNIVNKSPLVSSACGSYEPPHTGIIEGSVESEGGMGTDTRGISVSGGDMSIVGENTIMNLESCFGDVTGLDLMCGAMVDFSDVNSAIDINGLVPASQLTVQQYKALVGSDKTPHPNNFDMCTINIEQNSALSGEQTNCVGLLEYECSQDTNGEGMGSGGALINGEYNASVHSIQAVSDGNKPYNKQWIIIVFMAFIVVVVVGLLCLFVWMCLENKMRSEVKDVNVVKDVENIAPKVDALVEENVNYVSTF